MRKLEEKFYKNFSIKPINIAEYGSTYVPHSVEIDGKLYPEITNNIIFRILEALTINGYTIQMCTFITENGIEEFGIWLSSMSNRYHGHDKDFKVVILKTINLLKDDEDVQVEIQSIFERNH